MYLVVHVLCALVASVLFYVLFREEIEDEGSMLGFTFLLCVIAPLSLIALSGIALGKLTKHFINEKTNLKIKKV